MEFTPRAPKNALKIRFIQGSLNRFDGKTLSMGLGEGEAAQPLPRRKFLMLCRKIISLAKQNKAKEIAIDFKDLRKLAKDMTDFEVGEVAGTAFVMADYEFVSHKSKPTDGFNFI